MKKINYQIFSNFSNQFVQRPQRCPTHLLCKNTVGHRGRLIDCREQHNNCSPWLEPISLEANCVFNKSWITYLKIKMKTLSFLFNFFFLVNMDKSREWFCIWNVTIVLSKEILDVDILTESKLFYQMSWPKACITLAVFWYKDKINFL